MTKNIYRVMATSRETKKEVVCYMGDRACMATATYEDLLKRKMFMEDFSVRLERLDPIIVMESK